MVRFLRVTPPDDQESEWMIPGYPSAPVAAVETSLQQVMGDLLAEPASAVRVEVDPSGGLRLIAAGSEPVEIPGPAGIRGSLVAWGDGDTVLDTWPLRPPSATDPLILAPGDSVVLDADGPAKPVGDRPTVRRARARSSGRGPEPSRDGPDTGTMTGACPVRKLAPPGTEAGPALERVDAGDEPLWVVRSFATRPADPARTRRHPPSGLRRGSGVPGAVHAPTDPVPGG